MQVGENRAKRLLSGLARWWWAALAAVVLVAGVVIWGPATRTQGAEQKAPAPQTAGGIAVKTAKVTEGSISANLTYSGDVKAVAQVTVQPKGSGRIEQLLVDVGSRVKKGDVIAQLDSASLKAQVSQARANLAAAEAKYAGMKSGSRDEQIAQAKAGVDAAQSAADAAEARANIVKRGATENDINAAQGAVDAAKANLDKAKAAQDTVKIGATQAQTAAAKAAVDASKLAILAAQANLDDLKAGPKDADLWAAQSAVNAARANLYSINDKVTIWKGTSTDAEKMATQYPSVSAAVEASGAAQVAVDAAVSKLNQLKAGATATQLQDAQTRLMTAKSQYDSTSAALEQLQRGATVQDLQQVQAAVDAASAGLVSAQATLKKLQDGPTEDDIKAADAGVNQAKSAVAQAQQSYQLLQNPYTQNDLGQSNAAVMQAQAVVDQAEIGLSEATIVSPVDGVVSDRPQSVGNLVGPATPIVSILSNEVELILGVEESQIGQVQEGQRAQITVAAYPGVAFPAKVALIAPSADAKSRTFQVKVRPDAADGKLKQGMFAQVTLVTQEKPNVTLVPKDAVVTKAGQTSIFVLKGDAVQQRSVKVGLAKDGSVEILSGVEAGEEVVVAGQNDLRDGDKVRKS
jgi:HlyD family secretion protein